MKTQPMSWTLKARARRRKVIICAWILFLLCSICVVATFILAASLERIDLEGDLGFVQSHQERSKSWNFQAFKEGKSRQLNSPDLGMIAEGGIVVTLEPDVVTLPASILDGLLPHQKQLYAMWKQQLDAATVPPIPSLSSREPNKLIRALPRINSRIAGFKVINSDIPVDGKEDEPFEEQQDSGLDSDEPGSVSLNASEEAEEEANEEHEDDQSVLGEEESANEEGAEIPSPGQTTHQFNPLPNIRRFEPISQLADSAGLPFESMVEMISHKLQQNLNLSKPSVVTLLHPTSKGQPMESNWEGDRSYLYRHGTPTCFGAECSRAEFINAHLNMSLLSKSQFMSSYWQHVDLNKVSFTNRKTLISRCASHLCTLESPCKYNVSSLATGEKPLRRFRRLSQLLNQMRSIRSQNHCLVAASPDSPPMTNWTPLVEGTIGDKVKRARFIGNSLCNLMNGSTSDLLRYVGAHQCHRAREIAIPLLKAPRVPATGKPKRKKGKRSKKGRHIEEEEEMVVQTLTARYIKVDKIRYHLFHPPTILSLRNVRVGRKGVIYGDDFELHPEAFCDGSAEIAAESVDWEASQVVDRVFVASSPSPRHDGAAAWTVMETLPRIASHFEELERDPGIAIHVNAGAGGGIAFLQQTLQFLGLSRVRMRLVSGSVRAGVAHFPEPGIACRIPGEWQVQRLRDLIQERLMERGIAKRQAEILVVERRKTTDESRVVANHDALVRMLEKDFRAYTIRVLREDAMPSVQDAFAAFNGARLVIAPEGSHALGYVVAMQAGTTVVEVLGRPRDRMGWNLIYSSLTRSLGMVWYGMVLEAENNIVDLIQMHGVVTAVLQDLK
ncbi:hypothetical protein BC830DRAFT_1100202 [Chytriomyces sp. MP71]|nr:hypothetical protein BC830DRAFT_1100202 [Chytriomyces sp. MP71]